MLSLRKEGVRRRGCSELIQAIEMFSMSSCLILVRNHCCIPKEGLILPYSLILVCLLLHISSRECQVANWKGGGGNGNIGHKFSCAGKSFGVMLNCKFDAVLIVGKLTLTSSSIQTSWE
jgi:hypothetical protein